ncbi:MAG: amidohydrolase family protein, partial [Alphaproteobacteria bacterium]|nr:amidohydrolase family protein [Alphaproteobacteria bacterium]
GPGVKEKASRVIAARGGALLPGLHDHHVHIVGLAGRAQSVWCGPPAVLDEGQLSRALENAPGSGWIRAIGYHESVLGYLPDASELDRLVADRPLRMQHRSGRMWLLNSAAIGLLLATGDPPPGMEREGGCFTGRLFDADAWLRTALGSAPPDLSVISADLARLGVTGLTDMTPQNGPQISDHFTRQRKSGALAQSLTIAGTLSLGDAVVEGWTLGPVKLHLHEADLPPFDEALTLIRAAHDNGRAVAIHCVSEVEIVFALALLDSAGAMRGDRIEHASIATPDHVAQIACMGLAVCVQPHFVAERGDRYLVDVEPRLQRDLYRLASLTDAGIALAGGSDAPFASHDPWAAMRAVVSRSTAAGEIIGPDEALSPEQALSLWLADPADFGLRREIRVGAPADLCLLDRPWADARMRLSGEDVVLTLASGEVVHDRVDQPPVERPAR